MERANKYILFIFCLSFVLFFFVFTNLPASAASSLNINDISQNAAQTTVTVKNDALFDIAGELIIGVYDKNNFIIDIKSQLINISSGQLVSFAFNLKLIENGHIKAFILHDLYCIMPLTNSFTYSLNAMPTPSPTPTPSKKVFAFTTYYYAGDSASYNAVVSNSPQIDEISTATHVTDGFGNITGLIPSNQITFANEHNITPLIMICNNFDGNISKTLLESSVNRQNFIDNLKAVIISNGYKGVNIDIENVPAADRDSYTALIRDTYNALKPLGYFVTVSLPAKTIDSTSQSWTYAYNYAAISSYADRIIIMAYDEHYPVGSPGAVASINWVSSVVNYALTAIPKEKILLGTAAYGYDWWQGGTKAYSIGGCYTLAANHNAEVLWDDTSKCPYFTYTDTGGISHTVWFENATSLAYKLDLVNQRDISGIAIWRLGLENTNYWDMIRLKLIN